MPRSRVAPRRLLPPPAHCRHRQSDRHFCLPPSLPSLAQSLTRANLFGLAMAAAATIWAFNILYEKQHAAQRAAEQVRAHSAAAEHALQEAAPPARRADV